MSILIMLLGRDVSDPEARAHAVTALTSAQENAAARQGQLQ
jgi:hypothetical protein